MVKSLTYYNWIRHDLNPSKSKSLSCLWIFYSHYLLFPICWSLILCYQLIKNGTGGIGTETSHFRLVGCLKVWSCLNWIFIYIFNTKSSWWCLIEIPNSFECKRKKFEQTIFLLINSYHGPNSQHFIFFLTHTSGQKPECYIPLGWKGLPGTNTLAYWTQSEVFS